MAQRADAIKLSNRPTKYIQRERQSKVLFIHDYKQFIELSILF